jgi:DNA-directed RNA polymerase specialized sigma24 family protein
MSEHDVLGTADDAADFYAAVRPHLEKMARVAARLGGPLDRDDIVQDALFQSWRARRQFDATKGTLSAWLLAITAHEAVKLRRRAVRQVLARRPADASTLEADVVIDLHRSMNELASVSPSTATTLPIFRLLKRRRS